MVTDTYNVPSFSSIAGPFDLGRKHVRKKLQKEAKDIKPLTVYGDQLRTCHSWDRVKDSSQHTQIWTFIYTYLRINKTTTFNNFWYLTHSCFPHSFTSPSLTFPSWQGHGGGRPRWKLSVYAVQLFSVVFLEHYWPRSLSITQHLSPHISFISKTFPYFQCFSPRHDLRFLVSSPEPQVLIAISLLTGGSVSYLVTNWSIQDTPLLFSPAAIKMYNQSMACASEDSSKFRFGHACTHTILCYLAAFKI